MPARVGRDPTTEQQEHAMPRRDRRRAPRRSIGRSTAREAPAVLARRGRTAGAVSPRSAPRARGRAIAVAAAGRGERGGRAECGRRDGERAPSTIIAVRSCSPPAPRARARANAVDRRSAIEPAASASTASMTPSGPATSSASSAVVSATRVVTSSRSAASRGVRQTASHPSSARRRWELSSRICSARRGTSSNATSSICSGYQASIRAVTNASAGGRSSIADRAARRAV